MLSISLHEYHSAMDTSQTPGRLQADDSYLKTVWQAIIPQQPSTQIRTLRSSSAHLPQQLFTSTSLDSRSLSIAAPAV